MPARKKTTKKVADKKSKKTQSTTKKTTAAKPVVEEKKKRTKKVPQTLRGMKDSLPKDSWYWRQMHKVADGIATAYGYHYVQTPVLEETALFTRAIGKGTDVIDKEMYNFEDRDGKKVSLRPEGTASAARMYLENGLHVMTQPVKMWYLASMFRHDRPQAGRYREHHQFGCEVFGEHDPVIDAELISVGYHFFKDLGIDTVVHINSLGTADDRERYLVELVGYLRSKRNFLSDVSKKRINKNPLRVLDSKEEQDQAVIEEAPQMIDWLSDDSKKFFMCVLEYLDEVGIPYVLTPTLVRGLDYYTDTVFEYYPSVEGETGRQSALGGGGRYNGLVPQLADIEVPGAGFGLGMERTIRQMKKEVEKKKQEGIPHDKGYSTLFFAQLGEKARQKGLAIIEDLRQNGIRVQNNLAKKSLKVQLELANKYGCSHAIILGQKELQDGTVIIRDMESGIQEIIDQKKLKNEAQKIINAQQKNS